MPRLAMALHVHVCILNNELMLQLFCFCSVVRI